MSNTFSIKVEGLDRLQKSLGDKAKTISNEIDAEIGFACDEAVGFMQTDAPADQGFLRNHISKEHVGRMNYNIVAQSDYAAYVEFGTRSKVQIPAGLEAVAASFKGRSNISAIDAKTAIFEWCARKGIDKELWYTIFISIMVKGIRPHPFFFRNFERVKKPLLDRIQKILTSEGF
ncbi:MAG: HK97 gp10 family phage protein [Taibaiella sp.]|nr:HK97 gp10 family phage protein [Taibaiella sp.]